MSQDLSIRIDAKPVSGLDKPFKDLAGAAKDADAAIKGVIDSSGKVGKGGGGASGALSALGKNPLEGFVNPLKKAADITGVWADTMNQATGVIKDFKKDFGNITNVFSGNLDKVNWRTGTLTKASVELADAFTDLTYSLGIGGKDSYGHGRFIAGQMGQSLAGIEQDNQRREQHYQRYYNPLTSDLAQAAAGTQASLQFAQSGAGKIDLDGKSVRDIMRSFNERGMAEAGASLSAQGDAAIRERDKRSAITRDIQTAPLGARERLDKGMEVAKLSRMGDIDRQLQAEIESQQRVYEIVKQQEQVLRQQGAEKIRQLAVQREALAEDEKRLHVLAEAERSRAKGFQAEFGMLDPIQQRLAKELAAKTSRGEELSGGELEAAKRYSFFGDTVAEQAGKMGERAGFADIARDLGIKKRVDDATAAEGAAVKARIDITNEIKMEMKINEASLADFIGNRVMPELQKLRTLIDQKLENADLRTDLARKLNAVANQPGP